MWAEYTDRIVQLPSTQEHLGVVPQSVERMLLRPRGACQFQRLVDTAPPPQDVGARPHRRLPSGSCEGLHHRPCLPELPCRAQSPHRTRDAEPVLAHPCRFHQGLQAAAFEDLVHEPRRDTAVVAQLPPKII